MLTTARGLARRRTAQSPLPVTLERPMVKVAKRMQGDGGKAARAEAPLPVDRGRRRAEAVQHDEVRSDRSRSSFGWGSIPSRPTNWCAARSCCRTASARSKRVVVFAKGDQAEQAKAAGADEVGAEELAKKIKDGWTDFDACIAAPDMMGMVGPLGNVLGPRGLMPSPRAGTVTPEVAKTVREYKAGKVEFRNDAGGIVHARGRQAELRCGEAGREHPGLHRPHPAHEAGRR